MRYHCPHCSCDLGGIMAAGRALVEGCPVCGGRDVASNDPSDEVIDLATSPRPVDTQEMPSVYLPADDEIPF